MKIVVCGSRSWDDRSRIVAELSKLADVELVIAGGAAGADRLAEDAARSLGIHVAVVLALWEGYGKRAGYLRNVVMLDLGPDLVLAFWDGESRGTQHTIREAEKRGIPVVVVRS